MNTGVAYQDKETDAEEKLGDTGKVEEPRASENRHSCEALEALVRGTLCEVRQAK